jgi:uncharacterized membrane protein AbrB (regulator of aidB expression)
MSKLSIEKLGDNLPASGLAAVSQAAVGFGVGLLVSGSIPREARQKVGIGLVTLGVAVLVPLVAGVVTRVSNRPESARRVRKQLDSIRQDSGFDNVEEQLV